MKAFTDMEQSKILAEILPIESADGFWEYHDRWCSEGDEWEGYEDYPRAEPYLEYTRKENEWKDDKSDVPCWSLAALLEQLPEIINYEDDESDYALEINKENDLYYLSYGNPFEHGKLEVEPQENFVDACVEMIEKLHEQNIL